MLVCCVGDAVLDVIVSVDDGLEPDDDVPARITLAPGGQAANTAAWLRTAGAGVRHVGPVAEDSAGSLVRTALTDRGIELSGPMYPGRNGTVVSVLSEGSRSMASDPGDLGWPAEVIAGADLAGASWLLISGYALYRIPDPESVVRLAARAHAAGTRVGVDLASARMLADFGTGRTAALLRRIRPTTVFANDAEWAVVSAYLDRSFDLVLKHGPRGCSFVTDETLHLPSRAARVVDATGAGDALAAGYVAGGPELAMTLAAQCVAHVGAQPPPAV